MIVHLQYLRGHAALMVVVYHVTDSAGRLGTSVDFPHFAVGFAGVDLFFVISGFIIFVTSRKGAASRPMGFVLRRLLRIVPLYWLITALLAATAIMLPNLMGSTVFEAGHALASFAFLPAIHPTFGVYNPLLVVGWTLNYEMAFYALLAVVLLLPQRIHLASAVGAIMAVAAVGLLFGPAGSAGFYTDPIILEFAAGLIIGQIYVDGTRLPLRACLALVAAGTVGIAFATEATRSLTAGVPAALIVAGAVFAERASGPVRVPGLHTLGDASYALYLVHLPALAVFQILYGRLGLGADGAFAIAYVVLATSACVLAGLVCHRVVEQPLNRILAGLLRDGDRAPRIPAVVQGRRPH